MEKQKINFKTYLKDYPNSEGYFGRFGGAYISDELKEAFKKNDFNLN